MSTRRTFIKKAAAFCGLSFLHKLSTANSEGSLPKVLILGDSISIGYFPKVRDMLEGKAEVLRPFQESGRAENCQGTTYGVTELDRWLGDTKWDVIHFNFGLHDLKHVDPVTRENSKSEKDPRQAEPRQYKKNLEIIVNKLLRTEAQLIFATTTPYPEDVGGPVRVFGDVERYNKKALKVMKKYSIPVNDLYSFVLPQMDDLQRPKNVHFSKTGNQVLAEKVVNVLSDYL